MAHEIQYRSASGKWWVGHHGTELKDPEAYVVAFNKNEHNDAATAVRVVDTETGECYGEPGCAMCGDPHEGVDGACLL